MQLKDLKPIHKNKRKMRIARGGKKGTTSGRGTKGQKSRTGHNIRPAERDMIKKMPKLRGYRFKGASKKAVATVNLGNLEAKFSGGDMITPAVLLDKGLVSRQSGRLPSVKILGAGELKKKLFFKECSVSASAKKSIEKAGGRIEFSE